LNSLCNSCKSQTHAPPDPANLFLNRSRDQKIEEIIDQLQKVDAKSVLPNLFQMSEKKAKKKKK
jgi:hypothetical protein